MDSIDLCILASAASTMSAPLAPPPSDWPKPSNGDRRPVPYCGEGAMQITTFNMETGRWEAQVIEWRPGSET